MPRRRGPRLRAGRAVVLLGVALLIGLLAYGLFSKAPRTTIDDALSRSEAVAAPPFELPVLQPGEPGPALAAAVADGRLDLDELRGTPVVLNFWASWCAPCRQEMPLLERTWRDVRGRGVAFVGLNMQDLTGDARGFLRRFDVSYPTIRDQDDGVALAWGATGLPETFFVSRRGKVVAHVIGVVSVGQLRAGIAAAESGRAVGARRGGDRRVAQ